MSEPPTFTVVAAPTLAREGWWDIEIDGGHEFGLAYAPSREDVESCVRTYIEAAWDLPRDGYGLSIRWGDAQ